MKHTLFKLFLTALLLTGQLCSFSETFTVDGIVYSTDPTLENVVSVWRNSYSGEIVIPSSVTYNSTTYSVTSISHDAFSHCTGLTSVSIPNSVTSIGEYAFYGCTGLTSVTIPKSVTTIGGSAFSFCSGLTSVAIPNSVTTIAGSAFQECTSLPVENNIRYADTYLVEVVDKTLTTYTIKEGTRFIASSAFGDCTGLTEITIPNSVTSISNSAFCGCTGLTSVTIPNSVTSIGNYAFSGCTGLTSVTIPNSVTSIGNYSFDNCSSLTTVGDLSACTSIGYSAFYGCSSLTSIGDLSACTSIEEEAFYSCSSLTSIGDLSACVSIGGNAFTGCNAIISMTFGETIPTLVNALPSNTTFYVPAQSLEAYRVADKWEKNAVHILAIGTTTDYDVTVTAQESSSDVIAKIGEANLGNVVSLKVTGTVNGYDIMAMRNKMVNLHHLDLSDASIVANPYEYYTGYHTEDNILGGLSFSNLILGTVKLPRTLIKVAESAFVNCKNLFSVEMYEGVTEIDESVFSGCSSLAIINFPTGIETIGRSAFSSCTKLTSVVLPQGLKTIGGSAFSNCLRLVSATFPNTLVTIEGGSYNGAFANCSKLASINLPTSLTSIGPETFSGCSALTEVRIPSSITTIGNKAFNGCSKLKDIYTWTVEPVSIGQNTFSTWTTATIHTPSTSHDNYYYNTQWSQFLAQEDFDEPYEYFYINNDYTLDDQTNGRIDGTPDADLNEGSGLIVEGNTDQDLGDVVVHDNGEGTGASIIGDGNINASSLVFEITIKGGKWHFFCFPFNVLISDIEAPSTNWVFRRYDGQERANNGNGGWKNLPVEETMLHAGQGYIFQCNKNGTLRLTVRSTELTGKFAAIDKHCTMTTYTANNAENASWNFIGNPHLSYYDMDDLLKNGLSELFSAPITRWNSSTNSYEAIRPGDDDYFFHPFEAFFVQKPEGVSTMDFCGDKQTTNKKSKEKAKSKAFSRKVNPDRMLVNLELTDGTATDKTRVVFNDKQSMDYEIGCDAAKFIANDAPQLYTIDRKQVKYAINERPVEDGSVQMAYTVAKSGQYEITATRMDCPVLLLDQKLGTTFDLSLGSYSFTAEAGSNSDRFILVKDNDVTGVSDLMAQTGVSVMPMDGGLNIKGADGQSVSIYTVNGVQVGDGITDGFTSLQRGAYIVKVGNKSAKVMVK